MCAGQELSTDSDSSMLGEQKAKCAVCVSCLSSLAGVWMQSTEGVSLGMADTVVT